MDGASFASLAQVRILLLPVGNISKASFDKWAALVRSFQHIRLDEITPETHEDKKRFMPTPHTMGYLHLTYPSHPPPSWHAPFSLFRPSHFPLGVIGIAECSSMSPIPSLLVDFQASVSDLFPKGSAFPLSSKCYAFEEGDDPSSVNLGAISSQIVVIPSVMGNKQVYIGTLLAELCAEILADFTGLAKALESESGMEALNSRLLPQLGYAEDPLGTPVNFSFEPRYNHDRLSVNLSHSASLSSISSARNSMEVSTSPANGRPPPPKRSATIMPSSASATLAPVTTTAKKRTSMNVPSSCNGRAGKVVADLYLLAGLTADAVQCYMDAMPLLKGQQDVIWLASAMEGMCVAEILDEWSSGDGTSAVPTGAKQPWADISERLNQIIALYARATPSGVTPTIPTPVAPSLMFDGELSSLSLLYCQSVLRHSHFLLAIWGNKAWGKAAFDAMFHPNLASSHEPSMSAEALHARIFMSTFLTRTMVSNAIGQTHGPHLMHLQPHDRLQVLNVMAAMYSYLGFHRKEVFVLREVLAVVMDMLVTSREDMSRLAIMASSPINGSALASPVPGLAISGVKMPASPRRQPPSAGTVGVRQGVSEEGNESVLQLVRYVCQTYGVDLQKVGISKAGSADESKAHATEEEHSEPYGWPELQIGVVREAVAVAEALPDYPTVAQFALSTLKTLHLYLSPAEQSHLYSTSSRALDTARRRGDDRLVEYWAGKPVLSLEVAPLSFLRLPIEHPISDLEPRHTLAVGVVTGRRDPFIYNPRLKAATASQALAVQNEPIEFAITLYNPFSFDLDIQQLSLSTEGPNLRSTGMPTTIASESYRMLHLSGTALEPGVLTIRGVKAKLAGGSLQEFLLPISTDDDEKDSERRRSMLDAESVRTKFAGLDARPSERSKKRFSTATKTPVKQSFVTCKVLEEQPLLRIRRTTLTHDALMLYDGESSTVRMTLENISSIPVDFVKLTFDDSTIAPAQHALAEGDMSIAEAYETEYDLLHRPVFTWQGMTDQYIGPEKKSVVAVTCLGKYGCSGGSVQVSYSFARRTPDLRPKVFYTRQIIYPIEITVYQTLEARSMDILPCWTNDEKLHPPLPNGDESRRNILDVGHHNDWCLFSVDVCNQYIVPFEVTFERNQEGVPPAAASRLVSPGATVCVILPLRRLSLPESILSQSIPTLSDRQFVVAKEKLTSTEERLQRELFWYREHLLNCVGARWREPGTSRHGDLSLRSQRLTLPMLRMCRIPRCRVELSLTSEHEGVNVERKGQAYIAKPYEFLSLRAKVTNASSGSMSLSLSIIPASLSLLESALFDTSLSHIPIGNIGPEDHRETRNGVCFVDEGRYEFKASLEAVGEGVLGGVEANICILIQDD